MLKRRKRLSEGMLWRIVWAMLMRHILPAADTSRFLVDGTGGELAEGSAEKSWLYSV
jgi:hypothetical protein